MEAAVLSARFVHYIDSRINRRIRGCSFGGGREDAADTLITELCAAYIDKVCAVQDKKICPALDQLRTDNLSSGRHQRTGYSGVYGQGKAFRSCGERNG